MKRFVRPLSYLIAALTIASCKSQQTTGITAPAKPLTPEQETLLQQIESQPADKRQAFIYSRMAEVQKHSLDNRTFGERMNSIVGAKPQATQK